MTDRNARLLAIESHPHVQSYRKVERWRAAFHAARAAAKAATPDATPDQLDARARVACQASEPTEAEQYDAVRGEVLLKQASRSAVDVLADMRGGGQ